MVPRAEQKEKFVLLTLKSGQDSDNFATVIASLEIGYSNEFDKECNTAALV